MHLECRLPYLNQIVGRSAGEIDIAAKLLDK